MDLRKQHILQAIIEQFIETAEPVGSHTLITSYRLEVSPATVRNEMAILEHEGYIAQPHTSAGRIPTELGYRFYVNELADFAKAKSLAANYLKNLRQEYHRQQLQQKIFHAVSLLAKAVDNISFATLPENNRTFYIGVANILRKPEFMREPIAASQILEILEAETHFINALKKSEIDAKIKIFIGTENIIPQIASCSIIVTRYNLDNQEGFIGILGPKRMNYPFNAIILEEVRNLLEG